jgi:hypothetical protein
VLGRDPPSSVALQRFSTSASDWRMDAHLNESVPARDPVPEPFCLGMERRWTCLTMTVKGSNVAASANPAMETEGTALSPIRNHPKPFLLASGPSLSHRQGGGGGCPGGPFGAPPRFKNKKRSEMAAIHSKSSGRLGSSAVMLSERLLILGVQWG